VDTNPLDVLQKEAHSIGNYLNSMKGWHKAPRIERWDVSNIVIYLTTKLSKEPASLANSRPVIITAGPVYPAVNAIILPFTERSQGFKPATIHAPLRRGRDRTRCLIVITVTIVNNRGRWGVMFVDRGGNIVMKNCMQDDDYLHKISSLGQRVG